MTSQVSLLRSRVARRIFILFIVCALLPIGLLAVISYRHVATQLREQSQRRLHQASKAVGLAMYERLLLLESESRILAASLRTDTAASSHRLADGSAEDLRRRFRSLAVVGAGRRIVLLFGAREEPAELTAAERAHLTAGRTLLSVEYPSALPARIFISRAVDPADPRRGILIGEINTTYLWGIGDDGGLPPMTELCVLDHADTVLFCSLHEPAAFRDQLARARTGAGQFEWSHQEHEYLAGSWSIPLRFAFLTPKWTVVLSESKADVLAPMGNFRTTFSLVLLLSLWIVLLLSLSQIRRSMIPLQQLQQGTRRLAMGDFTGRVSLKSRDEFEELAVSFNAMAGQLQRQFNTLATMGEIDRAILSALDTQTIVDTVLTRMRDISPCDGVSLTLLDPGAAGAARTYVQEDAPNGATRTEATTLTLEEIETLRGHPEGLSLPADPPRSYLAPMARRNMRWFFALPIFVDRALSGVITLAQRVPPARDEEGLVQGRQVAERVAVALVNAREIADRKRAEASLQESNRHLEGALSELKATQGQIIQQERLLAVGQMASGIAHDFNNALSPILGFSEVLLDRPGALSDTGKVTEYLQMINTAARDATSIVSRLRDFYRPREAEEVLRSVNLNQLIEQAVGLTEPRWKDQALARGVTIRVETDLPPVQPVSGNEAELREVLTNLIFNAVDAMAQSGTITLRTHPDGESVVLEVSDTGAGMPEEVRRRCLEPFFSTKGEHGTGLGLSIVYGIIRRHEGTIAVESQEGKGATFIIRLPVSRDQDAGAEEEEEPAGALSRPLRVLLVEDDPRVRPVLVEYLTGDGHTAEVASTGREGLAMFHASRFDLVITDQAMPEMSGEQLAATIKRAAPKMPIILLTGFGNMLKALGEKPAGTDVIVSKPVTLNTLRKAVAQVMAA